MQCPQGKSKPSSNSNARRARGTASFYSRRIYEGIRGEEAVDYVENPIPPSVKNRIFCKSSERMSELPDCSVHLMVTSPPYNVGKEYDEDLTLSDYRGFLKSVMSEVYRALVPGGRACVNLANIGRRPYLPLHAFVIQDMLEIGFLMRGEIIWDKGFTKRSSTAWGSWCSPSNPVLEDLHEYILIFSKQTFGRPNPFCRCPTIGRDEFLRFIESVWHFSPESAKRIGHPAPFPVELPYRLIQLYTFEGEVVLDPFMGSGTTAVASMRTGRVFVGYEINPDYVALAEKRIGVEKHTVKVLKL